MKQIIKSMLVVLAMVPLVAAHAGDAEKKSADVPAVKKTIAAIYAEKAKLNGKKIQVDGKVVKVFNGAMERNFLHIKDGTGKAGSTDDLTITSQDTANMDDEITAIGYLTVDKDFGAGYKYEVILEQTTIKVRKAAPVKE